MDKPTAPRTRTPLVSVITPSYNQAQFIEETLLSVRGQDYANLEHIVIDGGSTDGTIDILRNYEDKYNLRWVSEPDEGQSDAISKGFEAANGEVIGWVNSDDTYMPDAISTAMRCLQAHPEIGWTYGDGYWIDERSYVLATWTSRPFDVTQLICESYYIMQPTVLYRRELLQLVGYPDKSLHYTMDMDFFFRMALASRGKHIPRILATRRIHDDAKTKSHKLHFIGDRIATLDKLFSNPMLPREIAEKKKLVYSRNLFMAGCWAFEAGATDRSRQYLWTAIRLDPNPLRSRFLRTALLLMQSYLGLRWYVPGQRALKERHALAQRGISVRWRS